MWGLASVTLATPLSGGETFVMTAAAQGHLDVVDYLVRVHPGTDVSVKANSGGVPRAAPALEATTNP